MKKKKNELLHPLTEYLASKKIVSKKKDVEQTNTDSSIKQRITIHLSKGTIDRAKNAVYWEPGLTLTDLAERALIKELDALEKKRGEAYPQRKNMQLKGGRPLQ